MSDSRCADASRPRSIPTTSGAEWMRDRRRIGRDAISGMGSAGSLAFGSLDPSVDRLMVRPAEISVLRRFVAATIGLGLGFTTDVDPDAAVETRPARIGLLLTRGSTAAPGGVSSPLGGGGGEGPVVAAEGAAFSGRSP
jgi:hypothetical protein